MGRREGPRPPRAACPLVPVSRVAPGDLRGTPSLTGSRVALTGESGEPRCDLCGGPLPVELGTIVCRNCAPTAELPAREYRCELCGRAGLTYEETCSLCECCIRNGTSPPGPDFCAEGCGRPRAHRSDRCLPCARVRAREKGRQRQIRHRLSALKDRDRGILRSPGEFERARTLRA